MRCCWSCSLHSSTCSIYREHRCNHDSAINVLWKCSHFFMQKNVEIPNLLESQRLLANASKHLSTRLFLLRLSACKNPSFFSGKIRGMHFCLDWMLLKHKNSTRFVFKGQRKCQTWYKILMGYKVETRQH
jgi:hypothetical protein